jgi:peptidoglycan L-alanyl-D-glutamate endopeptidase CwlK
MPKFSKRSKKNLETCYEDLQILFNMVVKEWDCTVICGTRGMEDQNKAYTDGKSQVQFPDSKHNSMPSEAVDVMPYHKEKPHIRWDDDEGNRQFAWFVKGVAIGLGIKIRCGIDWKNFPDAPHYELLEE